MKSAMERLNEMLRKRKAEAEHKEPAPVVEESVEEVKEEPIVTKKVRRSHRKPIDKKMVEDQVDTITPETEVKEETAE